MPVHVHMHMHMHMHACTCTHALEHVHVHVHVHGVRGAWAGCSLLRLLLGRCEGGIGIAARLHGRMAPLLRTALEMATACPCRDGCWCRAHTCPCHPVADEGPQAYAFMLQPCHLGDDLQPFVCRCCIHTASCTEYNAATDKQAAVAIMQFLLRAHPLEQAPALEALAVRPVQRPECRPCAGPRGSAPSPDDTMLGRSIRRLRGLVPPPGEQDQEVTV